MRTNTRTCTNTRTHHRCHLKPEVHPAHPTKSRFQFRHVPGKYLAFKQNGDPHQGGGGDWCVTVTVEHGRAPTTPSLTLTHTNIHTHPHPHHRCVFKVKHA